MKPVNTAFIALLIISINGFVACNKDQVVGGTENQAEQHAMDQNSFSTEVDAVNNDAGLQVESLIDFTGRPSGVQSQICDATIVVNTNGNPRTITITYNGTNCWGNRTRQGVVVISMAQGIYWKDPGAVINVSFQNLKITCLSTNKSITINGTQSYTNVTGGLLVNLPTLNTIIHTITSNGLNITFENGTQRTWQVAKQRLFSFNNGIVIAATGTHTEGTVTNVAEWGTNRFGNSFTTSTIDPLIVRQNCNFRLTSGKLRHTTQAFNATATFGLDAYGNPTTCPGTAAYYYKLVWMGPGGQSHTIIAPY
jgi:hypothetical protein